MKSSRYLSLAIALVFATFTAAPLVADVKTREKGHVKFEGMLGTMMRMFGGKAANEGVTSTNAVRGNRKATLNDSTGRIVDLGEEKVYDLDMKKKEYTVTTFDELRRKIREAQERAAKEAKESKDAKDAPSEADRKQAREKTDKDVDVDFDVKETGKTKSLAGYDTREVVMTITVREKGKTLEDGGGLVVTADSWLAPEIPALKELADFEMRYWKAIAPETAMISAEQMAAVMAMYPMIKQAMDRLNQEQVSLKGTPLSTITRFEAVKSKAQIEEQNKQSSGGGLSGMLARRMMKKNDSPRATIFTIDSETLEIATSLVPADLELPADFKLKK